jgi:hypothetical protein
MGYNGGAAHSCSSFADPTKNKSSDLKLIFLEIAGYF